MTTTTTKPLTPRQIEALRYLAANPSNPVYPDGVQAGTLALLRRRGLVGKHKPNRRTATTSPITDAGRALLASLASLGALDAPVPAPVHAWSVLFLNRLYRPNGDEGPMHFRHDFPGATAAEAHAAGVVWAEECGDCEALDVAEVEGPLSAPSGAKVST